MGDPHRQWRSSRGYGRPPSGDTSTQSLSIRGDESLHNRTVVGSATKGKNASAISMRILRTRRSRHRHPPRSLRSDKTRHRMRLFLPDVHPHPRRPARQVDLRQRRRRRSHRPARYRPTLYPGPASEAAASRTDLPCTSLPKIWSLRPKPTHFAVATRSRACAGGARSQFRDRLISELVFQPLAGRRRRRVRVAAPASPAGRPERVG